MFECNICLEPATEPVVTRCGHLFCWSCLHQWISQPRRSSVHSGLQPSNGNSLCPVCKAAVSAQTVTPIYARGGDGDRLVPFEEPTDVPARPQGERLEPESPPPEVVDPSSYGGGGTMRYGFAASYGQFPVICALAFLGPSAPGGVPSVSRRLRLGAGTLMLAALASVALM
mmetsp:Transcript_45169/g.125308  ORF Transcript_45169/g.125308 Transcript_45169/m.125308 type:complete len:171 (-) Transcript_45169:21-533(-)